jgi:transposase
MQGKKDYQEKLFIRFQLSDYVPQDNFYRQLKSILDFSFLYASTSKYYGTEGQKSIDPVVFMKLMLVGYLENLNSDRRIITTSRMRMDILYFIGYDLDEELPWHSTLSRTRQLYGEEQFLTLFKVVLKQCIAKGLVSGKRQAIDSVFVKANAAMSSMVSREILQDATTYSRELESNSDEQDSPTAKKGLKKDQPSKKQQAGEKPAKRTNKTHVSPSDPDARMSYKPGKVTKLNYLGQVSVDTAHHVITHIQAFHADQGDGKCLPEVLENVANNLSENSLDIQEVTCDAGYSSELALQALADRNIQGYIPNVSGYRENRDGFIYDTEKDHYSCRNGKYLTFRHLKKKGDNTHKIYKTGVKDCWDCPFKNSCANSVGYKAIEDSISKSLYDQMYQRMSTQKGKLMRRLRSSTVEPVLGTLVNFTAMDQVYTKGINLAGKCMIMAAVAYNLKKLINGILNDRKKSIRKSPDNAFHELKITLLASLNNILILIGSFKINDKNKWLNNHLLCKLNYSAI